MRIVTRDADAAAAGTSGRSGSPRASVRGSSASRAEGTRELTDGMHVARVRDTILICHGRSRVYLSSARGNSLAVSFREDPRRECASPSAGRSEG